MQNFWEARRNRLGTAGKKKKKRDPTEAGAGQGQYRVGQPIFSVWIPGLREVEHELRKVEEFKKPQYITSKLRFGLLMVKRATPNKNKELAWIVDMHPPIIFRLASIICYTITIITTATATTWEGEQQPPATGGVRLQIQDKYVVVENGILQVTLSKPEGSITKISYNGIDNLLEQQNRDSNRGYWDLVWTGPGITRKKGLLDRLEADELKVIVEDDKQVELSFTRTWNSSSNRKIPPLNIDKRYIMLRDTPGLYSYIIYDRPAGFPHFTLTNTRLAFKLNQLWFHDMAVSDTRQRSMPLPDDRLPNRSQPLAYPEAVLLTDPIEPEFRGEVDDKYQYGGDTKDIQVHGWMCRDPPTGLWHITPSNEFRSAGPSKQFLTSHVGPTSLSVLLSTHYAGAELTADFAEGEPWKKVLGPLFLYVNSIPRGEDWHPLWDDAKRQLVVESKSWPYTFPASGDYLSAAQRGSVSGKLLVRDSFEKTVSEAAGAFVGLAAPGAAGSWQRESKGYQFWVEANKDGSFFIDHIRPGNYSLYGYVPGYIGDYKYDKDIEIVEGSNTNLGDIAYEPPREGPILWEIGVPDRSAKEFFIPDPNPKYINKLYLAPDSDRYRQYGLWDRYTDLYPDEDLVYTVNASDYTKDWFFAQVGRKANGTYGGTTWQIRFELDNLYKGVYTLRIALASVAKSELQVRVNDREEEPPLFTTGTIGKDNSVARHGIHGLYWLYSVEVPSEKLVRGDNVNTIYLTQPLGGSPWRGIMYDYIRLESPPSQNGQEH